MKYIITITALFLGTLCYAQNVNWSSWGNNHRNMRYANLGYNFGVTAQLGYGRKIKTFRKTILNVDYSSPMGKKIVDDFKLRIGGQISLYDKGNFTLSAKVYSIFRRHATSLVRMTSFGSETTVILGYYRSSYHLAAEVGFDKSAATYLNHSDALKENFPQIKNGWLLSSGGHFFYGLQAGKSLGDRFELSVRAGPTNAQFDDENALLPMYAQVGLVYKW